MEPNDSPRFLKALIDMGIMFSDELSTERQQQYWALFEPRVSIEEWEYAAEQAMFRESFHKVPLPDRLMSYVRECRAQNAGIHQELARAEGESWLAAQRALEASPEWKAQQLERLAAETQALREHQAWLKDQNREALAAKGFINPPNPARWLPLTSDFAPDREEKASPLGQRGLTRLDVPQTAEAIQEFAQKEQADEPDLL